MAYSQLQIWGIVAGLGVGTFLLRYSFLGLVGRRELPDWALRHLRYTPVAVLPGLVAPQIFFPPANDGITDPARLAAAIVTLAVGYVTKSTLWAIAAGFAVLMGLTTLLG